MLTWLQRECELHPSSQIGNNCMMNHGSILDEAFLIFLSRETLGSFGYVSKEIHIMQENEIVSLRERERVDTSSTLNWCSKRHGMAFFKYNVFANTPTEYLMDADGG